MGLAGVAMGDELYRQDSSGRPAWSTQDARNAGGLGWFSEAADNFPGTGGDTIIDLVWWGSYSSPLGSEGNTNGFTIRIYDDNAGSPGVRLDEQDVMVLGTGFTETYLFDWTSNFAFYEYTASLPVPFVVPSDGQYWVSIVAILDRGGGAVEPQWFVGTAASVTLPNTHQWFFDPGNFGEQSGDIGFILNGTLAGNCAADLTTSTDPNDPGFGVPDGILDANDFFFYLGLFGAGDLAADLTGSINPNDPGFGVPDGTLDANDFFFYLDLFAIGCAP